jgi:hypothetical protein
MDLRRRQPGIAAGGSHVRGDERSLPMMMLT